MQGPPTPNSSSSPSSSTSPRRDGSDASRGEVLEGEVLHLPPPVPVAPPPPPARAEDGGDRVVAVAVAVTVSSLAVLAVLRFVGDDEDEEAPGSRGRRR